ncbi:MAG: F0F1 ATP synthase subunit A [Muribaculaceae bacterium]|nr:F0F1 ATP synthase subunit A [Muribaculaceae bacterium]
MVTVTENEATGEKHESVTPVIHEVEKNGKKYYFYLPHLTQHKTKVVQLIPEDSSSQAELAGKHPHEVADAASIDIDGQDYRIYKPLDISITKNVLALFIAAILVTLMVMSVVRYYARKGMKAPRKGMGFMEMLIDFIYTGVIKNSLGAKANKFAPYLLTCFFFILTMNLLGLIVIFPGGANLTGNIAITLVLAVATFVVTNVMGTKHYWKEIFWPDVPLFLKFPLPIMQMIEVFGIFTKPAALCVRLFANMMGGHMIVITLTLLIFIFAAFGAAALGASVVVSVLFSIFMLLLDVLVSFIQAYVFTLLSALFISISVEDGHHEKDGEGHDVTPAVEA